MHAHTNTRARSLASHMTHIILAWQIDNGQQKQQQHKYIHSASTASYPMQFSNGKKRGETKCEKPNKGKNRKKIIETIKFTSFWKHKCEMTNILPTFFFRGRNATEWKTFCSRNFLPWFRANLNEFDGIEESNYRTKYECSRCLVNRINLAQQYC